MTTETANFSTLAPKKGVLFLFYPVEALGVSILFYSLDIIGFTANIVVIIIISRSPSLKTLFNYIILSLSASDLISAIADPLFVYRRTTGSIKWILPNFVCKIQRAVENGPSVATSLHIVFLSLLRFISIQFPHQFRKVTIKQTKVVIFALWLIAFCGGSLPFLIWANVEQMGPSRRICHVSYNSYDGMQLFTTVGYLFFYHIPMVLIVIFSVGIAISLRNRRKQRSKNRSTAMQSRAQTKFDPEQSRRKKESLAIMQTFLIVGSFAFGYLPNTAFYAYTALGPSHGDPGFSYRKRWWFAMSARICLRLSECLNPVLYNIASSKMRKETRIFLGSVFTRLPFVRSRCTNAQPVTAPTTITALTGRTTAIHAASAKL
ncbi:growth hormone secretagogue receptor type 1-like [Clavelina lepadiformis]|uniref:G-protein coupled receptors family 1 profile domain-containing protein n=1 Tax=Clavelina lepadiformis TaxID=159417 RepID=A0ABP0FH91_CLALP